MKGFTLIEMLVSVALFSIAMVLALGSLLSLSSADRKAESLKAAINNVNFALDSMSRDIRTGWNWGCNTTAGESACNSPNKGANEFSYTSASFGHVIYKYDTSATDCGQSGTAGCVVRSVDNGSTWAPVTAPEIIITGFSACSGTTPCMFYVKGADSGSADNIQPEVVITISGYVQVSATQQTPIHMQTAVTQRLYDQ